MSSPEQQLHELRQAVLAIAVSLGAALPHTPEVKRTLDVLADTVLADTPPPPVGNQPCMKALQEHAANCGCDRCASECGVTGYFAGNTGWGPHTCFRKAPHKGKHECCCGDAWKKGEFLRPGNQP